jgi:HEAT repeat protein
LQQAILDPNPTIQARALELLAERDHPQAIALLLSATKSDEPERRFQALNLLHQTGYADVKTILSALGEALADEDANVRSYAVQALAERGGPDALMPLRQALRDPDSSVRMMLIQNIVPEDQGLLLLREALFDEDETLRSAAASKLEQPVSEDL